MTNQEENIICCIKQCQEPALRELSLDGKAATAILDLCQSHTYMFTANQKQRVGKFAQRLEAEGIFSRAGHTKGWMYVVRMSSGHIKIGFTAQEGLQRLLDLSRYQDGIPVQIIAVVPGGESLEALTHANWSHLRVPGRMEQFHADPSLLAWAEGLGIDPTADEALEDYSNRLARKHESKQYNNAGKWAELLNVAPRLTGSLNKNPLADWSNEVTKDNIEDWEF
ncbi:hypothetical protein GTW29_33560 [Streptomyces sp. SID7834]|nr:hypothetical protein [Streptomyces sp. SID7834]MYT61585.1 hypothetical protein [Streptomyces sp. SID7834]